MIINKKYIAVIIFLGSFHVQTWSQGFPSGHRELNNAGLYFLRKSDFVYLYHLKIANNIKSAEIDEDFLTPIVEKNYKKAEKWLLERYNHPYYLLNLILLYMYLDQKEYKPLFLEWQKSVDQETMIRLIDILDARDLGKAQKGLSGLWSDGLVSRYALYKSAKQFNQAHEVQINFTKWKEEIGREFGKEGKEKESKKDKKYQSSFIIFNKAQKEWLAINSGRESRSQTGTNASGSQDREAIEDGIIEQKYTRDVLSKYLEYLRKIKKWDYMEQFVEKIPWLPIEEKKQIQENIERWQKETPEVIENPENVKVRIY